MTDIELAHRELLDRLTHLIQFYVYAEAKPKDVQGVIDGMAKRDSFDNNASGWIIVKEDDHYEAADKLEALSGRISQIIAQYRVDLASAHAEICKLQGLDPSSHVWPEWSPQANTLRWLAGIDAALAQTQSEG